jgi:hypothetical protein
MSDRVEGTFEELAGDGPEENEPTYRATIRSERVTVTTWVGWMATGGALGQLFADRERAGVAIADLTVEGEQRDELIARFYSPGRSLADAEAALIRWATQVGYGRLWLTDRVVELDPAPELLGRAEVRCPTCRAGWSDANPEFWLFVRNQREFPRWCPLCGCELPQWTVRGADGTSPRGTSALRPSDRRRTARQTNS